MNNNLNTIVDLEGGSGEKADEIFKLQEDGIIKLIERIDDNFNVLIDKDDVHIGQKNKGI